MGLAIPSQQVQPAIVFWLLVNAMIAAARQSKKFGDQTGVLKYPLCKPFGITKHSLPFHFPHREYRKCWQAGQACGHASAQLALLIPSEFVGLGNTQGSQTKGKLRHRRWLA